MALNRQIQERVEKFLLKVVTEGKPPAEETRSVIFLRFLLKQLSNLYRSIVQLRLFLYKKRMLRHHELGCQVISIGNLTVGGTGKTPVVEIFARRLQQAGRRVAILSRGYKKEELPLPERILNKLLMRDSSRPPRIVSDGKNLLLDSSMGGDEPYMLASHLPEVIVLVDKDRVKSGIYAIDKFGCDTLILDDGFQYLSLKHRVDIALVDRRNPFGNEYVLPRGILREPVKNIKRASTIFITKCDGSSNEDLRDRLSGLNSDAEIIECTHKARYLQDVFSSERKELSVLDGMTVTALTGIAAPEGFINELQERGATVEIQERFADHHRYTQQELIDIINKSRDRGVRAVVTTEKDAVRFPRIERADVPVYFLRVDIELLSGTESFDECISRICFKPGSNGNGKHN
jgi:tetraacyldisaccharide 4'-kinase